MSDEQSAELSKWAKQNSADGLPHVVLPSGPVTITECASNLFTLIGPTKKLFSRGGAVVHLITRDDGLLALDILRPAAARSHFEKFGQLFAWRSGLDGKPVLKPVICPNDMAEALLLSEEAQTILPRVKGLINCPILREINGQLSVASRGYDEQTSLLITGGETPSDVELNVAVTYLLGLFEQFNFQTEGDKARAVASLISPALKVGGFLQERVPADVAEADQSQSGKTYRQRIIAAIYNERVSLVTCREGGVGSVDESLNQQLVAGRPFIQFDNFRGRFQSAHVECFLTAEGSFPCRIPHRGEITVQPESYFVFLTSNGVDTTRDFANRSNIVRIRKQRPDYEFEKFAEGDLLHHVRHWQGFYLGCVFAVVREWHRQGKLRTSETRHNFREWVQVVDWIGQHIFRLAPVMDGHQQAQESVSNPNLVWMRRVVLTVNEMGGLGRVMTATDLHSLCENAGVAIPGLPLGADEGRCKKVIGTIMSKLFGDSNSLEVDGFTVTRDQKCLSPDRGAAGGNVMSKIYTVARK